MPHESAARGYSREADAYARARPSYPPAAIADLCAALGLSAGDPVVELGAGGGIFTRQLLDCGLAVTAVEPVPAMRRRLQPVLEPARISAGTAESTGLPDDWAHAVFAATAWHWFDAEGAIREVRRLLRAGGSGGLGLIWNGYDRSVPWVAELADISHRRRSVDTPSERSWRPFFGRLDGWLPLHEAAYPNPWMTDPPGIVDRIMSSSVVAALPTAEQDIARDEALDVLARYGLRSEPTIELAYVTRSYWTRPISG